jgi:heterodisulfide reductase subunit C
MIDFGYTPNLSRAIDLDKNDLLLKNFLTQEVRSFAECIGCGSCAATCTAKQHTDFNILQCNFFFRRGEYDKLLAELDKCMLCGKCILVCPRNVNTRGMIIKMRLLLNQREINLLK